LNVSQAWFKFFQPRREEFGPVALQVRVRILPHQQKHQLWILWRRHTVDCLQILEFRVTRGRRIPFCPRASTVSAAVPSGRAPGASMEVSMVVSFPVSFRRQLDVHTAIATHDIYF
jgi:hypothetical protein